MAFIVPREEKEKERERGDAHQYLACLYWTEDLSLGHEFIEVEILECSGVFEDTGDKGHSLRRIKVIVCGLRGEGKKHTYG